MMNATELRAAAERVVASKGAEFSREAICIGEAWECADHILATVHADDDEPVTVEWWRTLPGAWFADLDGEEKLCINVFDDDRDDPDDRTLLVYSDDSSWGFWEQNKKSNELHSPQHNSFKRLKTRGQVRRLLSALGIEVKHEPK